MPSQKSCIYCTTLRAAQRGLRSRLPPGEDSVAAPPRSR
jgi:hypothetical protein